MIQFFPLYGSPSNCQEGDGSLLRKSLSQVFLGIGVLKLCRKFAGEHPCQSVISIKLLCIFIEITLRHGCSPVNLLHIFRTAFYKSTYTNRHGCISDTSLRRLMQRLRDISERADFQIWETSPVRCIKDIFSETSLRSLRSSQKRLKKQLFRGVL